MGVTKYSPFLMGEPFLFPKIWEWMDYMQKEGVYVSLYTNAEYLDAERLSKYKNIWYVNCSLNAATAETHAKVMRGPKWETVIKNINELIKKAPFSNRVSFVMCDENIHELEAFKALYHRRRVSGFGNWTNDKHTSFEVSGARKMCYPLFHQMMVLWDGRVVPCCMDYNAKMVLGDANKQTLQEIWDSYGWMRLKHRQHRFDDIPVCRGCNYNCVNLRE